MNWEEEAGVLAHGMLQDCFATNRLGACHSVLKSQRGMLLRLTETGTGQRWFRISLPAVLPDIFPGCPSDVGRLQRRNAGTVPLEHVCERRLRFAEA